MQIDEAQRILMVSAGASRDEIRQAYLDLVRVWHPDRLGSDAHLRAFAEEQLRRINEAYEVLSKGEPDRTPPQTQAAPPSSPPPHRADPSRKLRRISIPSATALRPRVRFPFRIHFPDMRTVHGRILGIVVAALVCLTPFWLVTRWSNSRRLASQAAAGILADSDARLNGGSQAAGTTEGSEWAAKSHEGSRGRGQDRGRKHEDAGLRNGAEVIAPGEGWGAGELRFTNRTTFEIVASLFRGRAVVRRIYIAPNSATAMARVRAGTYRIGVEAGLDYDTAKLRFRSAAPPVESIGPLEFIEFTSGSGTSGQSYEVVLNPNVAGSGAAADLRTAAAGHER